MKSRWSKPGRKAAVVGPVTDRAHRHAATARNAQPFRWPAAVLPWAMAETICQEASVFLGLALPRRYAQWLTAKAEVCFQKNAYFRRHVRGQGNAPRAYLYMNMRHWLAALLGTERRDLWACLPETFDLGQPLPPGPHPRINRRNKLPLPRPRRWNPALVLSIAAGIGSPREAAGAHSAPLQGRQGRPPPPPTSANKKPPSGRVRTAAVVSVPVQPPTVVLTGLLH